VPPPPEQGSVLVVDDDADLRDCLADLLGLAGYEVHEAAGGREALGALRGGLRPSLILLDLMMPEMSGWEFRDQQRAEPELASIPVVVLTAGRSLPTDDLDAAEVLYKPIAAGEVLDAVSRHAGT
jgi:CheY-like chemotaxis protein